MTTVQAPEQRPLEAIAQLLLGNQPQAIAAVDDVGLRRSGSVHLGGRGQARVGGHRRAGGRAGTGDRDHPAGPDLIGRCVDPPVVHDLAPICLPDLAPLGSVPEASLGNGPETISRLDDVGLNGRCRGSQGRCEGEQGDQRGDQRDRDDRATRHPDSQQAVSFLVVRSISQRSVPLRVLLLERRLAVRVQVGVRSRTTTALVFRDSAEENISGDPAVAVPYVTTMTGQGQGGRCAARGTGLALAWPGWSPSCLLSDATIACSERLITTIITHSWRNCRHGLEDVATAAFLFLVG